MLHLSIRNTLSEVECVTRSLHIFSEQLGLPRDVDQALQLAAEELLANIIVHGYPDGQLDTITVDCQAIGDEVLMLVRDRGVPFNPLKQSAPERPVSLSEAPVGGLGIHLVRRFMDDITYGREAGGNTLLLKKRLKPR